MTREIELIAYVPIEDGESYDDAWCKIIDYAGSALVTNYDDLERGAKAHQFKITVRYEEEMRVGLPEDVYLLDDTHLVGPRNQMLLLARTIHDILEGGS